ncbi:MAG TPA: DedA family protein [Candidatus Scybalousia intestinigallinarum]|nr:DedA family protein [Candidatus Scybalousia intestinigallinarum]
MQEIIISFMDQFGYLGIMLLVALENVFPPIPSEVILAFGGFMTTYTSLHVVGVIISATIGSVVGAIILYLIGKLLNKERLISIVSGKVGKILRLKPKDIEKADKWFDERGNIAVFFCRFVPIVRSLISIPAGMSDMPIRSFLLFTTIGTLIWNTVLVILGSKMGENWTKIVDFISEYASITLVVLVIGFIAFIAWFYFGRLHKKKKRRS